MSYVVSEVNISVDYDNQMFVRELKYPMLVIEVHSFLILVGYYRRFSEKFSVIAVPLTKLTRKDLKCLWKEDCKKACYKIKH